jgi:hydroxymethylglutaryl-CoA synthase
VIGIVGVGVHVPRYRLSTAALRAAWEGGAGAGEGSPELAVANHDEDSLTMAVEASLAALAGRPREALGAVLLASTTPPYAEKSSAALLATVADCGPEILIADLGGSLRAGTTALRLGLDAVRAGSARQALVAAADLRVAPPGGELEGTLGDGAAAVVLGEGEDMLARFEGAYSLTREFSDVWRLAGARFPEQGDPVFVRSYGYERLIPEAAAALLGRLGVKPDGVAHVACYAPDPRLEAGILRALGLGGAAAPGLLDRIGNTGAASPLLALAAALERAQPGERVLVVGYGAGADALLFEATPRVLDEGWRRAVARRGVAAQLAAGRPLGAYGKLLRFRRLVDEEPLRAFTALPVMQREEAQDLRLHGQRCQACGAVQYPRRHACWRCAGKALGEHALARRGRIFTFTRDHLVPSPDPPTVMAAADLEDGARFYTQMTDCDPAAVALDMPVELTFRRFHEGGELVNYFWKLRPSPRG